MFNKNSSFNDKLKILHIDDDEDFLELFKASFCESLNIKSLSQANNILPILETHFDAILLDYDMPEKNGLEILREIKIKFPDLPIVLYTGQGNEEIAREAFISGASDYFVKDMFQFAHKEKLLNSLRRAVENRKINESLKIERENTKIYFETVKVIMLVLDFKGNVNLINEKGCEILGYKKEEIIGKNWFKNFLPLKTKNEIYEIFLKIVKNKKINPKYYENAIIDKYGNEKIIAWHIVFLPDAMGNKKFILCSGEDITERKRMEIALKESENKYRTLAENTNDIIYSITEDGIINYANHSISLYGYKQEEIIGQHIRDFIHPDDIEEVLKDFQKSIKEKVSFFTNFRLKKKNGKYLHAEEYGKTFLTDNNRLMTLGIIRDISQRKSFEESLKKSLSIYQTITEYSNNAILTLDLNNKILHYNKPLLNMFNLNFNGNSNISYKDIIEGINSRIKVPNNFIDIIKNTNSKNSYTLEIDNGKNIEFKIYPYVQNEKTIGRILYFADLTNQIKINKKLSNKNTELQDFIYFISHDLKNPINLIKSYIMVIRENPKLWGKYFDRIEEKANFMVSFINNLLKLSRAGKVIGKSVNIETSKLIRRIFNSIENKNIKASLEISNSLPNIYQDPMAIRQVFTNIIQNAFQYMDPQKDNLIISIGYKLEKKALLIWIKDNGLGIKKESLKEIFNPGKTLRKNMGTGFGLAITKKIIEASNGEIWAESNGEGKGTKFIIRIPYLLEKLPI